MRLSPMSSQPHDCMMTVRGTIPVMCAVDASLEASQDLRCSHTTSPMVHVRWQQSTGRTFVEQLILCKDLLPPHPLFPIHGVSRMALRYPQLIILGCAKLQSRQQHSPFPRERASFGHGSRAARFYSLLLSLNRALMPAQLSSLSPIVAQLCPSYRL